MNNNKLSLFKKESDIYTGFSDIYHNNQKKLEDLLSLIEEGRTDNNNSFLIQKRVCNPRTPCGFGGRFCCGAYRNCSWFWDSERITCKTFCVQ